MDRDNIVRISNDFITGTINGQDVHNVIYDFCMEKDPTKEPIIVQCIQIIIQQGAWQQYFEAALKYYKNKFHVSELYSKERDKGFDMFGHPVKGRDLLLVL